MITLNDLGRAAVAKANKHDPEGLRLTWDDLCDADKGYWWDVSLAVVERFVAALDDDTDIVEALASLRAEAGQKKDGA